MIDRTARDRLAEALRQLAAGTITNFEYEDRADAAMTSTQHKQKDPALWAVRSRSWFCYTDIRTQRFRGQEKLSKESRHEIARWVLFLKSDAEYLWPIKSFITLSGCILQILTLGLARYFLRSRYERIGP